ncbi:DUF6894 family protein [Methylobacterium planeticum]|uniref:DUF6894 family protein n=1 Tax=Methylobacterium planeticum TaxID=2615211 RepID=UPI0038991BC4
MPRYYFDLYAGGRTIRDDCGTELPDLKQAGERAIGALADHAQASSPNAPFAGSVTVRDADGGKLMTADMLLRSERRQA